MVLEFLQALILGACASWYGSSGGLKAHFSALALGLYPVFTRHMGPGGL